MRRVVVAAVLASTLAACQGLAPIEPQGSEADAGHDAGATVADAGAPDADIVEGEPDAAPVDCDEPQTELESGMHRAGRPCLNCHRQGGSAPRFTLGGTVYDGLASTTPLPGATIRVVDADGKELALTVHQNGNFYTRAQLAFPLRVAASRCPDLAEMSSNVQSGNCNGCHSAGARIYLLPPP